MGDKASISQTVVPQATRQGAHRGLHPLSKSRLVPHMVDHMFPMAHPAALSQESGTLLGTQLAGGLERLLGSAISPGPLST